MVAVPCAAVKTSGWGGGHGWVTPREALVLSNRFYALGVRRAFVMRGVCAGGARPTSSSCVRLGCVKGFGGLVSCPAHNAKRDRDPFINPSDPMYAAAGRVDSAARPVEIGGSFRFRLFPEAVQLPLGVTGNTPDSGSGESWFDPRRGNSKSPNRLRCWDSFFLFRVRSCSFPARFSRDFRPFRSGACSSLPR